MEIKDSTAFVTGSNRGIGHAFVSALLEAGAAKVYASARSLDKLDPAHREDPRVTAVALDVTRPEQVTSASRLARDVDLLINNAGTLASHSLLESSREAIESDLAVNFYGALEMAKQFAPTLEKHQGAMLNVLTLVSMASMAGIGGYAASKAAAWSMTQSLRIELGRKGVDVFAIYPGAIDTDMIRGFEMDKTPAAVVARNALDAIQRGERDSFPDPMSRQAGEAWLANPRNLEAMFAEM